MAGNLMYEVCKYRRNCQYLRKLLRDTKESLREVHGSGNFSYEQMKHVSHTEAGLVQVSAIIEHPPRLVILGQTSYAKASVVNELFGMPLLPLIRDLDSRVSWRMVRFVGGEGIQAQVSLSVNNSFELVENLQANEKPWRTIPQRDLEVNLYNVADPGAVSAVLEVQLRHGLLLNGAQVVVLPCNPPVGSTETIFLACIERVIPILVYALSDDHLSQKEMEELEEVHRMAPNLPIFFIKVAPPSSPTWELTESQQHEVMEMRQSASTPIPHHESTGSLQESPFMEPHGSLHLLQQLCNIGYLNVIPSGSRHNKRRRSSSMYHVESELVEDFSQFSLLLLFVRQVLHSHLVRATCILNKVHTACLQMFILWAFDMARDQQITPKRLTFAKEKEAELYASLMAVAVGKQEEIKNIISETVAAHKVDLIQRASQHVFKSVSVPESGMISSASDLRLCTGEIRDLVLGAVNVAVAKEVMDSVNVMRETFVGTLQRCLESLEQSCWENGDGPHVSQALKQIVNAAYQVEVNVHSSSSFIWSLWERIRRSLPPLPWSLKPKVGQEWKELVASDIIDSLSEAKLAKQICLQFKDRLKAAHELFLSNMNRLESAHNGRLEKTEEQRTRVRKLLAPKVARYSLEVTSLRDYIIFGMPQLGREIGRGQYGVVYACDTWAGHSPCAIKSVVPPDDKHWNDLALEFYYSRCVPEHDRIVFFRGSVIDHSYGGGTSPAVLLIMERMTRDLYSALRAGLEWLPRLQVAIDVIQAIRFLHSQGLVHRDVKLKNVLLDENNRAKLTDLGFCKPEAMMSGSIVGTPIHMAPELFSGYYDASVDVYAFGILFWYLCSGSTRLPYVFDQCHNKDQLWSYVRKGARPERLLHFDSECWELMSACWQSSPSKRPLLGDVEPQLERIMERFRHAPPPNPSSPPQWSQKEVSNSFSSSPFIDINYVSM